MEQACVWWIQRHICCHCLSPQGQMRLYAVVGVASLPAALPMHSSVEAHSSFQLHQIQWRYSHKYPLRPGDNLLPTFYLLQHQKSVILCLVLVIAMVSEAAPAKGGSKSMMKNRSALLVRTTFYTRERHPQQLFTNYKSLAEEDRRVPDPEEVVEATTLLATTMTMASVEAELRRTSLPVLGSAITTSSMAFP